MEAVESALSQTYPNIEVIIVDDASSDHATISILESISHPRVKVYRNEENLHLSGARNKGISLSNGKYIMPLDADDKIDMSYVQKAVEVIENNRSIGVVFCKGVLFGVQSGPFNLPEYSLDYMLIGNTVFATALFSKADWEKVGGYSEGLKSGLEDYDFWLSFLELGKEIYQIPEVLFYYRIKEKSMSTDLNDDLLVMKKAYAQVYQNHPHLYEKYKDRYLLKLRDVQLDMQFNSRKLSIALATADVTIRQQSEDICRLEREMKLIEQSTSWRITKPIRALGDVIRRLFRA